MSLIAEIGSRSALSPQLTKGSEAHRLVCRRCGCDEVARSHRRTWERAFSWIGILPYRCLGCWRRFYR
jgi:hypothetical protein